MTRKQQRIHFAQQHQALLRCPLCHEQVEITEASIVCANRHTFDFTKQGYVNLAPQRTENLYTKELFTARRTIINSGFYTPLHQALAKLLVHANIIADLGCGEGTHLQQLLPEGALGIGIDLAKEGVKMAASYDNVLWQVADLANIPLATGSVDTIVNILSPSNYKEFKRILRADGRMIKIVPSENYLYELREAFFPNKSPYSNATIIELFEQQFAHTEKITVRYEQRLTADLMRMLLDMTPLTQNVLPTKKEEFIANHWGGITLEFVILIGND
ncbi:MAG TPA: methyltransferase domain-containing protein [Metalysinibacillus sp.]